VSDKTALLECRSVSVVYGKKIRALHDLSLTVNKGEIVVFIGANGAGKSTIIKTVSGLLRPESGDILFESRPIHGLPAHRVATMGIAHVPEGRRIFSRLSVLENLELGAYACPERFKERLARVYEIFPLLKERCAQPGGTLSGGEQQMLAIGRALMSEPRLLMLDEPSMGLAPIMVEKIFRIIRQISAQGTTILLVEQNAHQSLSLAHRGYVLENGRIVLEGAGPELLQNEKIQHAYLGSSH
jgi:branched-chain amino acid transport system ATP-binding protein